MMSKVHVPAPSRLSPLSLVWPSILTVLCGGSIVLFANGFPLLIAAAAAAF